MTDRVIRVVLDGDGISAGVRRSQRPLEQLNRRSRALAGGFKLAAAAATALIGALSIREFIRTADAYQQVQNRLRLVTDGTEELATANERLFEIAQNTRQSFEDVTELYSRASIAAGELGASQEELFELVEITGQALAVQGGSSQEAAGALRQLSQSFSSGIVRAEEFNSILEGAFPIAQAAARGIDAAGGSVGRLRQLVVEGEVSSREFFEAILEGGDALENQFGRTVPTIDQSLTQLNNSFFALVGGIDEASGATGAISLAIQEFSSFLDENQEDIIEWVNTTVEAVIVGGRAIFDFLTSLDTRLAGFVADVVGTTGVILENIGFSATGERLVDQAIGARAEIDADLAAIEQRFLEFTDRLQNRGDEFSPDPVGDGAGGRQQGPPIDAEAFTDAQIAVDDFLASLEQQETILLLQRDLGDDATRAIAEYKDEIALAAAESQIFGELQPTEEVDELRQAFREFAREAQEGIRATNEELEAAALAESFDEQIEALEQELELLGASNEQLAINAELRALAAGATEEQAARIGELSLAIAEETDRLRQETATLEGFFEEVGASAQRELSGFLADPLAEGLDELPGRFARVLQQLAADALAAEIFDILRSFGSNAAGGGAGGFLQFVGGLFGGGFQAGGTVSGGRPILVGERGPEIFQPPSSGTIVPDVNVSATAAPAQVNVVNAIDNSEITGAFNSPEGDQVLLNRIGAKRTAFRQALGV